MKRMTVLAILLCTATAMPLAMAQGSMDDKGKTESAQPMSDTWITTKVKSDFLADTDVKGMDINVTTVNGVVKLSGTVDSQAQADKAKSLATGIDGVKSVDSTGLKVAKSGG